jgi:hypothetical protein
LRVVKTLLCFQNTFEELYCLDLASEVDRISLFIGDQPSLRVNKLLVAHSYYIDDLVRYLRKQAQVSVALLDLCNVFEVSKEIT